MKQISVHIATTDGPAGIQRITAEDPEVRSVVCLGGKAIALPISNDYDCFVRKPTGIIAACFGHSAFRVDVASEITGGLSWQLGIFTAHALAEANRLAGCDESARVALWATGEVDRDLKIGAVRDVALKLSQSKNFFARQRTEGARILIVVPTGNAAEAEDGVRDVLGADEGDVRIIAADTIADVLSALRLPFRRRFRLPSRTSMVHYKSGSGHRRRLLAGVAVATVAIVMLGGWNRVNAPESAPEILPVAAAHSIETGVTVSRAPKGSSCAEVHFGRRAAAVDNQPVAGAGDLPALSTADLCDVSYRVTNGGAKRRYLWVIAARDDAAGGKFRARIFHDAKPLAAHQSIELDAMPPRRMTAPLRQEFAVLVTRPGADAGDPEIRETVRRLAAAELRADWDRLLTRAAHSGASLYRFRQEFRP
ncbi:MAG: hypothetical protein ACTSQV_04450 [Alphaproteobacteria bacterium]